jgi:hypothetical protein
MRYKLTFKWTSRLIYQSLINSSIVITKSHTFSSHYYSFYGNNMTNLIA